MSLAKPQIVFEDSNLIVLLKPAGLLSQAARVGDDNLVDWLRNYLGRHYVGLLHRLDQNTSGLMVVAKRTKAASRLSQALREGRLIRHYRALAHSCLKSAKQSWHDYICKDEKQNKVSICSSTAPGAKEALTHVYLEEILANSNFCQIRLELESGRSHQIRAQAAYHGHPLIGDPKYGHGLKDEFWRPALHSCFLQFPHPISKETLTFKDEMAEDMLNWKRSRS